MKRYKHHESSRFVFLQKTYEETTKLLNITKEYFAVRAQHDRAELKGEARLAYTIVLSNIAVRLTSTLQWIRAMQMVENSAQVKDKNDEKLHLYKLDERLRNDEEFYGFMPKIVHQLAQASANVYGRVSRLEQSIWGEDNSFEHAPHVALPDMENVLQFKAVGDRDAAVSAKC